MSQPYPGLRPFQSDESDIFFGREEQTDELLSRLDKTRFLAIVGASGCGKSSLVRAGMIPALETGFMAAAGSRWNFVQFRPGSHPIRRLATALIEQAELVPEDFGRDEALGFLNATLRRGPLGLVEALNHTPLPPQTNLLVLVDQFEEIFRYRREGDRDEADAFVALLIASARQRELPIYVAITMRSDFIGDCAVFNGLPEALNQSQYLTPRLSREQLRAAIVGPARVYGGEVEPELVNSLLNEMGTDPDQLPLMQHLLMRIWNRTRVPEGTGRIPPDEAAEEASGRLMTMQTCAAVGGLNRALSEHLDEAFGELDDGNRRLAETLFRRLSERGADRRDVRRPTSASEIMALIGAGLEDLLLVVEAFRGPARNFLVPPYPEAIYPNTVLDISHESLIRQWDRLRDWAEAEAQSAETYHLLEQAARRWKQGLGGLWRTPDLEAALAWKEREQPTAAWAKRYGGDFGLALQFLEASENERRAEEAKAEANRLREVHRLRRSLAVLTVVCLCLLAGGIYLWDANREHVSYYSAFIKRWGLPQGVGKLTDEQVSHRTVSLRAITDGRYRPVSRVETVDSKGRCTPYNNVGTYLDFNPEPNPLRECAWEFFRDRDGHVVYEKAYNKLGQLVWGFAYTPIIEGKKNRSAFFLGPDGFPQPRKNAAAEIVEIEYSASGDETVRRFWDRRHHRQPGQDMAFGLQMEYYDNGLVRRTLSLDADDRLMNDNVGNAIAQYEYDPLGNPTRMRAFDKDGNKVLVKDGFHEVRVEYDKNGNRTAIAYFDITAQPARYRQRCHRMSFRFDQAGNVVEQVCFDGNSQPTQDESGCQLARYSYDEKGNQTEGSCFEHPGHKSATFSNGFHKYQTHYGHQGNPVEWRYFDTEGHPTFGNEGHYRLTRAYDDHGHMREEAYFDAEGRPLRVVGGYHKQTMKYDERGNEIARAYFNADSSPTVHDDGYHEARFVYDERGNLTEHRFFDSHGEPVLHKDGYHRESSAYNERGKLIEQAYFGLRDVRVLGKDGYHRQTMTRDGRGNMIAWAFFDAADQPVLHKDGNYRGTARYDARDRRIEEAYFGLDDKPVPVKNGYQRHTLAYDDRGKVTEEAYFGVDQHAVSLPDGYHRITQRYDDAGRLIEAAYFAPDGNPAAYQNAYAAVRKRYQESGRTVEESYLNAEGNPTSHTNGCFLFRSRSDARGRMIEGACLDASGRLIPSASGVARFTEAYDNFGNETEVAYFGADGKRTVGKGNYAIRRQSFDEHRRIVGQSFFGEDSKLRRLPDGYARITKSYDNLGNETEVAYFGEDGKPTLWKEGYAARRQAFEKHGQMTEQSYFGEDGKLVQGPEGFAAARSRYDEDGRLIEISFHDESGALTPAAVGIARMVTQYDESGNRMNISLLGAHGESLVPRTRILSIVRSSQAERLNLQPGDIIQRYGGREIGAREELAAATKEPGNSLRELVVRRGNAKRKYQVKPGLIGIEMQTIFEPVPARK